MALVLSIFGVAFAALCVWLGVRIYNRRERWAKWTLAGVLLLAYPLSLFPLEWLETRNLLPDLDGIRRARTIYRAPVEWLADNGPEWCDAALDWLDTSAAPFE